MAGLFIPWHSTQHEKEPTADSENWMTESFYRVKEAGYERVYTT